MRRVYTGYRVTYTNIYNICILIYIIFPYVLRILYLLPNRYKIWVTCEIQRIQERKYITMLEKDITNKILKYLKTQDKCYCFKEHGGSYGSAGIPDIICCYHGRFVAFEVKTEKGRTTKLQDVNIRNIREACGVALVVRSLDEVKDALKELIKSDG